jgi:hypothetical protein
VTTLCRALQICAWCPGAKTLQGAKITDGEGRFGCMHGSDRSWIHFPPCQLRVVHYRREVGSVGL